MPKLTVMGPPEVPGSARSTLAVIDAPVDKPLYFVLHESGVSVASACGGKAQCGLCRITVVEGWAELTAPVEVEETHLGNLMHLAHLRLSCQTRMVGDATIEVPRFESKEDRMRRKANARRLAAERAEARGSGPSRDSRSGQRGGGRPR